jgi:hypothetical protein
MFLCRWNFSVIFLSEHEGAETVDPSTEDPPDHVTLEKSEKFHSATFSLLTFFRVSKESKVFHTNCSYDSILFSIENSWAI